ncbi:MAG: recombinase RecT [Planctomycetota bacterium]
MTEQPITTAVLYHKHQEYLMAKGRQDLLDMLLGGTIDPRRFTMVALMAISKNRELLKADVSSMFLACSMAAELGLEPSGVTGHAYLVPYKGTVMMQPGFRGLIELAIRERVAKKIEAEVVYRGDEFTFDRGSGRIHHPYDFTVARRDEDIIGAYARAVLWNGETVIEPMDREAIEKRRAVAQTDRVWKAWYPEMCRKTAVKNLFARGKVRIPPGGLLAKGLDADNAAEIGESQDRLRPQVTMTDVPVEPPGPAEAPRPAQPAKTGKKPPAPHPEPAEQPPQEPELVTDGDVQGNPPPAKPKRAPATKGGTPSPSNKMVGKRKTTKTKKDADPLERVAEHFGLYAEDLETASMRYLGASLDALDAQSRLQLAHELNRDLAAPPKPQEDEIPF